MVKGYTVVTGAAGEEAPAVQLYVCAPPAVNVEGNPAQTRVLLRVAVRFGSAFTTTTCEICVVQEKLLSPVIMYKVEAVGVTTTLLPLRFGSDQVYELPPLTVILADCPKQICVADAATVRTGLGLVYTSTVFEETHLPSLPVTV